MEEFKRKAAEFWQDKKKRKGAIIGLIVTATVIASVTTVTITSVNSSTGDNTGNSTATNSTLVGAQDVLQGNNTAPNQQGNVTAQFDPTKSVDHNSNAQGQGTVNAAGINPISSGEGGGNPANAPANDQGDAPAAPQASIVCTVSIDCSSISGNGILSAAGKPWLEPYAANPSILPATAMEVFDTNGDGRVGVDEAIKQACNSYGIQYEFKGSSYLKGMNYLYEFDAGPNSGWMYNVNGRVPNKGCNSYYLNGGEDILWYYVISY